MYGPQTAAAASATWSPVASAGPTGQSNRNNRNNKKTNYY